MINFTRAFDSAWERMQIILFRPFDFGKWCAICFSAFLAGLLHGGNGFNSSFNSNNFNNNNNFNKYGGSQPPNFNFNFHQFPSNITQGINGIQIGVIVLFVVLIVAVVFGLILLMYWLGARGQFMFLDNIVRNRGAISWPWQYYARQANSLFLFYLLFMVISLAIILPILIVAIVMCVPLFMQHRWPGGGEIAGFVVLGILYLAIAIGLNLILFIFREFGIPLMFRNGLLARPAFWESMSLVRRYPGSIAIFFLLRIAIFIGVAILSVIICCATLPCCCVGQWPYVGTVILLPALIYVKCFTLDCLAQFGPEYDVWTVDVPPVSPQPPPG